MCYYNREIGWYLDQFPDYGVNKIRGEFSTSYLSDKKACRRIKKHFPDVKILVTLRNPIEMIYSLHWHLYNGAVINIPKDFAYNLRRGIFTDKGYYYKHFNKFFNAFPRENIHVTLFDDIKSDPIKTIAGIYNFLAIDSSFVSSCIGEKINSAFIQKGRLIRNLVRYNLEIVDWLGLESVRLWIYENRKLQDIYTRMNKTSVTYPSHLKL